MKHVILILSAAFILVTCKKTKPENTSLKTSDSTVANSAWKPVDQAVASKAWTDYATPGEMHKMLAKSDGDWSGQTTMWAESGGEQIISKSEATNKMMFNGRYQMSTHKGDMMGMAFEGISILAYDNAKKKFVSSWIDNMGTGIMTMEGDWNASTKSIEFKGKMTDPTQTEKECNVREVFTFIDDNTEKMEMFGPDPRTGEEFKTMEIIYKRK